MTDYVKTTDFSVKDSLPSGNPSKVIKGTEINTELDNIETAVATKANKTGAPANTNNIAMLDANGDLVDSTIQTDGAGSMTSPSINGQSAYGMVVLDTAQILVSTTTLTTGTTFDMSAAGGSAAAAAAAGATKAILQIYVIGDNHTGAFQASGKVWKSGAAPSAALSAFATSRTAGEQAASVNAGVVNLDSNSDFVYLLSDTGSGGTATLQIDLLGYYV